MMKIRHYILLTPLFVLMALLAAGCSSDSDVATDDAQPLPESMGRIRITICTPEANPDLTRAVGSPAWEDPDHDWEWLHSYRILICNTSNKVVQVLDGSTMSDVESDSYPYKQSAEITSQPLIAGSYNIYALANFADYSSYAVGSTVDPDETISVANGYSETNIPMTGKLTKSDGSLKEVSVSAGTTADAGTITVWRVMAKMQFEFTNEASEEIQIMGIEVDPINRINTGDDAGKGLVFLFSKDDLTSEANLAANWGNTHLPSGVTTGSVSYEISSETPLLTLAAKNDGNTKDEGTLFFYVNETAATFTTTNNQYSLRFKIKRGSTISELRYGVTTQWDATNGGGFNVIRRNDWIHIPIVLTDWHYRIEPLPFVPIGGYPAATVSSDGLTATFSTGGMIALQPFIKKKDDATWRDFGDTEVTYGKESWAASIHWKNSDGTDKSGDDYIVKTAFAYDPVSKSIIGELNQAKVGSNAKTTFTVNLKLGSSPQYEYTFTFNIVLQ